MSQNIAVLIGNTKYKSLTTLEACKNDVAQVHKLLIGTQKFSQVIEFVDQPVSHVKDAVRKLAGESEECEEIFLYFTGHGHSNTDEFYMCFEDFKETSPNTTGLSHTEALSLLRPFEAQLSVVVIDACEAGKRLIKSDTSPLASAKKLSFLNFMQFASCTENQNSTATNKISRFTDEFIKACLQKTQGPLYYSDVENGLRDAFLDNAAQTPHFIKQGTAQEKFCDDVARLLNFKTDYLGASRGAATDKKETKPTKNSFAAAKAAIEKIEEQVPVQDQAQAFIDGVFDATLELAKLSPEASEFFESRVVRFDDFDKLQNKRSVIKLLNSRDGSDCFVESNVERITRRQPFSGLRFNALAALGIPDEYDETFDLYNRCDLTNVHVGIYFEPKYMALNRPFSEIVFLPRLTECLILTCNTKERRTGWGSFHEYAGSKSWEWSHHNWKEDPVEVAANYVADPIDYVRNYILSFNKNDN